MGAFLALKPTRIGKKMSHKAIMQNSPTSRHTQETKIIASRLKKGEKMEGLSFCEKIVCNSNKIR